MLYELLVRPAACQCQCLHVICTQALGCSAACVPVFYVAIARTTLFLLPCHRGHYFYCWYDIIFLFFSEVLQYLNCKGSVHAELAEGTQRVLSGSSDWDGGRARRRQ